MKTPTAAAGGGASDPISRVCAGIRAGFIRRRLRDQFSLPLFLIALGLTAAGWIWLSVVAQDAQQIAAETRDYSLRVEALAGSITHLDEVLTMSARMAAASGGREWEERYRRFEPQLDRAIKDALRITSGFEGSAAAAQTDAANLRLVALENQSLALVRAGRQREASELLAGPEYEAQKQIYAVGMTEMLANMRGQLSRSIEEMRRKNVRAGWAALAGLLAFAAIWMLVLSNLQYWRRTVTESARAREQAMEKLRLAHAELERRVAERTADLAKTNEALQVENAERRRAEEEMHSAHAQLAHMIEHSPAVTYRLKIVGQSTVPITASENVEKLLGFPVAETLNHEWWLGRLHPEDREHAVAGISETINQGATRTEYRFRHKDGGYCWIDDSRCLVRDESGQPLEIIGVWMDITERKATDAALRESEERFRDLFENSSELIQSVGPDGRFIYVNPAWRQTLGYAEEEIPALNAFDVICPDHREECMATFQQIMQSEQTVNVQTVFLGKDGRKIDVEGHTHCRFKDGRPTATRAIFRDVTERKRAEAALGTAHKELVDLSRRAGMAEIATSVLHNVGNVLNSVNVAADLLSDQIRKTPVSDLDRVVALLRDQGANLGAFLAQDPRGSKVPEFLGKLATHFSRVQEMQLKEVLSLQKNVEHIKEIVGMQQSYARVSGATERLNITELVEDALRMNLGAFQRHGVQVVRDFAPGLPAVTTERHKVLQILINLLSNAKYACDHAGGGEMRVTVRVAHAGGRMRVEVMDTGVGITPENFPRIFNLGFTTKKGGHGFGLHSAANAAKEVGGSLNVHSDGPGRGTTFTLELPCAAPEDEARPRATPGGAKENPI